MEIAVDGKLPFLRMLFRKSGTVLTSEVYRKPTDSGLLLHFRSHVDNRYKDALVRTMIDRAATLSSTKQAVVKECDKLRSTFQTLQYPDSKFENIMKRFEDGVTNPIVKVFLSRRIRYIQGVSKKGNRTLQCSSAFIIQSTEIILSQAERPGF